jgi:hypothetical protein
MPAEGHFVMGVIRLAVLEHAAIDRHRHREWPEGLLPLPARDDERETALPVVLHVEVIEAEAIDTVFAVRAFFAPAPRDTLLPITAVAPRGADHDADFFNAPITEDERQLAVSIDRGRRYTRSGWPVGARRSVLAIDAVPAVLAG